MNARANILARLAAARESGRMATDAVDDRPRAPRTRPAAPPDAVGRFRERAVGLASDVLACDAPAQVPAAVARYLDAHGLPHAAVCWPELRMLPWGEAGIRIDGGTAWAGTPAAGSGKVVGITGAFCGIAETGTLMLLSGPATPATMSLLPETHVAIVETGRVVATMEDAWRRLRSEKGAPPRAVNFVSGPSRTADIEQTVTLGAHGPYRVCIVLVGSAVAGAGLGVSSGAPFLK